MDANFDPVEFHVRFEYVLVSELVERVKRYTFQLPCNVTFVLKASFFNDLT